jgi:hypothetical protein
MLLRVGAHSSSRTWHIRSEFCLKVKIFVEIKGNHPLWGLKHLMYRFSVLDLPAILYNKIRFIWVKFHTFFNVNKPLLRLHTMIMLSNIKLYINFFLTTTFSHPVVLLSCTAYKMRSINCHHYLQTSWNPIRLRVTISVTARHYTGTRQRWKST